MSAELDPRDELTERLAALGRRPVDPALQSEHLTALAGVRSGSAFRTSLAGRLKVAAGVMAGFLIGATGLTTAGAMGPLQPIAADVVEAVAPVDVPKGKADEANAKAKAAKDVDGKGSIGTARDWADCTPGADGKFAGNRGQYLKQERATGDLAAAKASNCGKPLAEDDEVEAPEVEGAEDEATADKAEKTAKADNGQNGEGNGKSDGKGNADEAGEPDEDDEPADSGKPSDPGAKPGTVPAPPAQEKADDNAKLPAAGEPGAPADGAGDDTDSDV